MQLRSAQMLNRQQQLTLENLQNELDKLRQELLACQSKLGQQNGSSIDDSSCNGAGDKTTGSGTGSNTTGSLGGSSGGGVGNLPGSGVCLGELRVCACGQCTITCSFPPLPVGSVDYYNCLGLLPESADAGAWKVIGKLVGGDSVDGISGGTMDGNITSTKIKKRKAAEAYPLCPWRKNVLKVKPAPVFTEVQLKKFIYDFYEKKLAADQVDDEQNNDRDTMPNFVQEHLLSIYGVKKMAAVKLQTLVNSIHQLQATCPRVFMFGRMTGAMGSPDYSPVVADLVLEILGRVYPNWSALSEILGNRDVGQLHAPVNDVIRGLIGVSGYKGDPEKWSGVLVNMADRPRMRQLCQRVEQECMFDSEKAAAEAGAAGKKQSTARKNLRHVDIDKMIDMVLEEYDHQADLEKERVRKIAEIHDVDGDSEISLSEFNNIIEHLAPGKFKQRKVRKMFLHLYDIYVSPGEDPDEDGEKAVGIPEVAAFCLSSGLFAPHENK